MIPALLQLRSAKTPFAWQRHFALLAWCTALGVGAWVVADLFWRLAAPRPSLTLAVTERDPATAAGRIAGRHLFGMPSASSGAEDAGRIVLFGTVTGDERQPGFAILSVDGGPAKDAVAGQELAPGLVLSHIGPDRIELSGANGTRTVLLQSMRTAADATNGSARITSPATGAMPTPATDTTRNVE